MAEIIQSGTINPVVPNAYVNVAAPGNGLIQGAPTNILGLVGVASWGPVDSVGLVSSNPQAQQLFGLVTNRRYDLSTAVAVSVQNGVNFMKCIRVTDGTDIAAHRGIKSTSETYETATIGGTITAGDICAITCTATNGSVWMISYTVLTGDTTAKIAAGLQAAANSNPNFAAYGFAVSRSSAVLSFYGPQSGGWTYSKNVTGSSETITLASTSVSFETATLSGSVTMGDTVSITATPATGPPFTLSYTVAIQNGPAGLPTLSQIAAGLAAVGNANPVASAAGFTFDSNGAVVDIYGTLTGWTFSSNVSGAATEVVTLGTTSGAIPQITFTSFYTGSYGNVATVQLTNGSAVGSLKIIVSMPGFRPEVFDSIQGSGNQLWVNAANAINSGQSGVRGPSQLVVASAGISGAGVIAAAPKLLAGGTDGATGVGMVQMIGSDAIPRTGIYALRGQGCSVINIIDLADNTAWATILAFALSEGVFCGDASVVGDTISNFTTTLANSGVDSPWFKAMLGDWIYWFDTVNGVQRLLSPMTFWAAGRAALRPQMSMLNQPILGIVATQKSQSGTVYTTADLSVLIAGRGDVIANPSPGGPYFSCQSGRNASSNPAIRGENYTMLTDYFVASMGPAAGTIVGMLQTATQRLQAKAMFDAFFSTQAATQPDGGPPLIGNADGTQPWQVVLNDSNNPPAQVALGYEVISIKLQYLSVIEYLFVNLEAGQTVSIQTQTQVVGNGQ